MKTLVFLANKLSQPRIIKRITSFYECGFSIKVYGYDDNLYQINEEALPYQINGVLRRRYHNYYVNLIIGNQDIKEIVKDNPNALFYVFSYETALQLYIAGCKNYVYEEADVNAAKYRQATIRRIALRLDRMIIKHSKLTVFTSKGFVDYLFPRKNFNNYLILPNKLSRFFLEKSRPTANNKTIDTRKLKFAFIGLVRYPNTIIRFAKVIAHHFPQHEFHFYGDISADCKDMIDNLSNYPNIFSHGKFKNPEELSDIYANIDVNIACYDAYSERVGTNVKIAEPNKLYESIYFNTPLIVSAQTYVGEVVERLGIGKSIQANSDQAIIEFIRMLDDNNIKQYINATSCIPTNDVIDNPSNLIERVKDLIV